MQDIISDSYAFEDGKILQFPMMPKIKEQVSGSGSFRDFQRHEINDMKPIYNNSRERIEYLRDKVNFNISQLATILNVKRPTIYEWLEDRNPSRKNLLRLDAIYALFSGWDEKIESRMGSYFYKKWDGDQSLYDVLTMEVIDQKQAAEYISKIQSVLLINQEARRKRQEIRDREGFEPVDQEQKERVLRRLIRRG